MVLVLGAMGRGLGRDEPPLPPPRPPGLPRRPPDPRGPHGVPGWSGAGRKVKERRSLALSCLLRVSPLSDAHGHGGVGMGFASSMFVGQ